jgi:hypothetical protein
MSKTILGHSHMPQFSNQFYMSANSNFLNLAYNTDGRYKDAGCSFCHNTFYGLVGVDHEGPCWNCQGTAREPIPLSEVQSGHREVKLK